MSRRDTDRSTALNVALPVSAIEEALATDDLQSEICNLKFAASSRDRRDRRACATPRGSENACA